MNACFQKDFPRDVCEMKHRVVMRIDAFRDSFRDLLTHALKTKVEHLRSGADAVKIFTPSLGIPYLRVWTPR